MEACKDGGRIMVPARSGTETLKEDALDSQLQGQNAVVDRTLQSPPEVNESKPRPAVDADAAGHIMCLDTHLDTGHSRHSVFSRESAGSKDRPSNKLSADAALRSTAAQAVPSSTPSTPSETPESNNSSNKFVFRHRTMFVVSMTPSFRGAVYRASLMKRLLSHYYTLYTMYLASVILIGTLALLACQEDDLDFINSLYLAISVVSMTGLSPVDFAGCFWYTKLVVWFLIVLASPMLLSIVPVALRRWGTRSLRTRRGEGDSSADVVAARENMEKRKFGAAFWGLMTTEDDEYLALKMIFWIVLTYWTLVQVMGWVLLWIALKLYGGVNRPFDAAFLATSAFHNAGLTTLAALPLDTFVLIVVMFLLLAGNTCFPLFVRLSIWVFRHTSRDQRTQAVLAMLMNYPRTCYTHLFPGYATRWLAVVTPLLVIAQIVALCISAFSGGDDVKLMDGLSMGNRILATIFQSVSTRTAGFSVVPLSKLSSGSAFVFCVCMWISSCPVVSIIRATIRVEGHVFQTYYDGSLQEQESRDGSEVKDQLRGFMGQDMFQLVLLLYVILVCEQYSRKYEKLEHLRILFEFCSAYGTVGLSMTSKAYAVSAEWYWPSKVCLLLVMFLGRLRGLPCSIDPAVHFNQYQRVDVGGKTMAGFDASTPLPAIGEDEEEAQESNPCNPNARSVRFRSQTTPVPQEDQVQQL